MDINTVPDDVWLEIFALLPPTKLVILQNVSRHFRALVSRPLLRNVLWIQHEQTSKDISKWNHMLGLPETLPQTATIKVPLVIQREISLFDARTQTELSHLHLYRAMQTQLVRLSSLHTLTLTGTTLGSDIFTTVSLLPTLRNLHIDKCIFVNFPRNYLDENNLPAPPPTMPPPFSGLTLTHLTLGNIFVKPDFHPHPITLITCPTLQSLEIMMTVDTARDYEEYILHIHAHHFGVHMHFGHAHLQHGHPHWQNPFGLPPGHPHTQINVIQPVALTPSPHDNAPAPNLRFLKVYIPELTNDLMPSLAHLTLPRPGNTQLAPDGITPMALPPRSTLKVDTSDKVEIFKFSAGQVEHYCQPSRYQHRQMWGQSTPVVQGVCHYTGPSGILSAFVAFPCARDVARIQPAINTDTNDDGSPYFGFRGYKLEDVCLIPGSDRFDWELPSLLRMEKNMPLLQPSNTSGAREGLRTLEIPMTWWDSEILYAVAAVWSNIESLVIRVGMGMNDEAILITISSDIISKLKGIHTLRIIEDPKILVRDVPEQKQSIAMRMRRSYYMVDALAELRQDPDDDASKTKSESAPTPRGEEEIETVRDYVHAWTRKCPSLRKVQIGGPIGWRRRWEGGKWERWIPDSIET